MRPQLCLTRKTLVAVGRRTKEGELDVYRHLDARLGRSMFFCDVVAELKMLSERLGAVSTLNIILFC
jgi:hypothetical protein